MASRALHELASVKLLVIVSGDGDFVSTLEAATKRGVRTTVIADQKTMSSTLRDSADEWLTIKNLLAGKPANTTRSPKISGRAHHEPVESKPEPLPEREPEREHVDWFDDVPVEFDYDELGRQGVAVALAEQLRSLLNEDVRRSFLVHIDGPWGAGKSTLMRFVQDKLAGPRTEPGTWLAASYDAWRQSKAGAPWLTLLETIRKAVRTDQPTRCARMRLWFRERARLVSGWQWIAMALIVIGLVAVVSIVLMFGSADFTLTTWGDMAKLIGGALPIVAAVWVLASSVARFAALDSHSAKSFVDSRADPMEDLAAHFRWILARTDRTVLLLIDDLDRCPESHVVDLLETIQKLLRDHTPTAPTRREAASPNLAILVAADGRWIKASYDNTYASLSSAVSEPGASIGALFLQKLFQLTLPVPRLSEALRARYIADVLLADRSAKRPDHEDAVSTLGRRIDEARSGSEVLGMLADASAIERMQVADKAIQRLVVDADAQAHTRHVLEPFTKLVDPTPRALKRYVMAYSMLRAVRTAEGSAVEVAPLALWTVLITRWPALGDYLQRYPDSVDLFKSDDERALKVIPPDLVTLYSDPPDELWAVLRYPECPLNAQRIRVCSGQNAGSG
jgi:hypothetical protein